MSNKVTHMQLREFYNSAQYKDGLVLLEKIRWRMDRDMASEVAAAIHVGGVDDHIYDVVITYAMRWVDRELTQTCAQHYFEEKLVEESEDGKKRKTNDELRIQNGNG